ncbi:hypothetical protein [uncultured Rothia sp.]|uniref:hypothetical protein n=1 Tax=uncultured Rothia sp. TaxID=316088 RepID=UPI0028DC5B62|nr:hypothetical protein [uncultured Rothia sp.]
MTNNQDWVPVSIRNGDREEFSLSDTIPKEINEIIISNVSRIEGYIYPKFDLFFARLRIPLTPNPLIPGKSYSYSFYKYMDSSEEACIDALDFILHCVSERYRNNLYISKDVIELISNIENILRYANVNWRINREENNQLSLMRRVMPDVQERYSNLANSVSELAGNHLRNSWKNAYMHGGNHEEAWGSARKAVECMLTPIVSPNNPRATISSLIRDMKVKPEKWVCTIPASNNKESVEKFISLLRMMPYEPGHHGQEPTEISEKEAQLQATLAITICQILHDGGLVLKSEEEQSE